MPSDFPCSPKILKGALVAYQLSDLLPTVIILQPAPPTQNEVIANLNLVQAAFSASVGVSLFIEGR